MNSSIPSHFENMLHYPVLSNKGTPASSTSPRLKILTEIWQNIFEKLPNSFSDTFLIAHPHNNSIMESRFKAPIDIALPEKLKNKIKYTYVNIFFNTSSPSYDLIYLEKITIEMLQILKKNLKENGHLILAIPPFDIETPSLLQAKADIDQITLVTFENDLLKKEVPQKDWDFFIYLQLLLDMNDLEVEQLHIQREDTPIYILSIKHEDKVGK